MDKELKETLKTAKDLLKNKDYKEVIKLCKVFDLNLKEKKHNIYLKTFIQSVIDRDKENYFAWVFTGAAAQELGSKEQAIAAYQKAIQYNATQAPAWQVNHNYLYRYRRLFD